HMQRQLEGHAAIHQRNRMAAAERGGIFLLEYFAFFASPVINLTGAEDCCRSLHFLFAKNWPRSQPVTAEWRTAIECQFGTGLSYRHGQVVTKVTQVRSKRKLMIDTTYKQIIIDKVLRILHH